MVSLLVIAASLFVLELLFGKRFGILILALAAGLVVSGYETNTVSAVAGPYVGQYIAYIAPAIVLAPAAAVLLFAKGRHRRIVPRVFSAVLFAGAGTVFIIGVPGTPPSIMGVVPVVTGSLGGIISGLIAVSLLEILFGKPSKKKLLEEPKK